MDKNTIIQSILSALIEIQNFDISPSELELLIKFDSVLWEIINNTE